MRITLILLACLPLIGCTIHKQSETLIEIKEGHLEHFSEFELEVTQPASHVKKLPKERV